MTHPPPPHGDAGSKPAVKYDYAKCDLEYCDNYALFSHGACHLCGGSYCYEHVENIEHHICYTDPQEETKYNGCRLDPFLDEVIAFHKNIDYDAVKEEVEILRSPHKCTHFDKPTKAFELRRLTGSFNTHIIINFDDEVKWVMRIRRKTSRCVPEDAIIECHRHEIATLKALEENGVKVPRSYERPKDSKLSNDLLYFYQEYVEGVPSWKLDEDSNGFMRREHGLTPAHIRFVNDYAAWSIQLETMVSPQGVGCIGSNQDGSWRVGPHIEKGRNLSLESPYSSGPFDTPKQRWLHSIECRMKFILEKRESSPHEELLHYLKFLELRELVKGCAELEEGPWTLKHNDLHQGNFRVDQATGELKGVIDWEWASYTGKAEAFASPSWLSRGTKKASLNALGDMEKQLIIAYEELGRPDLAEIVKGSAKYHCLEQAVNHYSVHLSTLNATYKAFLGIPDDKRGKPQTIEEWMDTRMKSFQADPGLQILLKRKPSQLLPKLLDHHEVRELHWARKNAQGQTSQQ
ncbi:uncharacterized protein I303_102638 [Kwoniella dejecticola CBS 10117]|uniref:Aminoglycoside phosphotransferase domain-containing protein n=1 Tax=Kwoniella dejecticola CBS 10117 TaxID=1296121 RepID=A0A1A6A9A9_9TREE|nr:uncharacterized protein I303_02652 [Kwoniella dejecticola CBS 10117]OBR86643.1 hypothetical protein I303_02652 [Kwoniella dejecticola CBS 10117]